MDWEELISLKEAAELFERDESTLRRAISNGILQDGIDCKKFGKQWVILRSSMERIYGDKERRRITRES